MAADCHRTCGLKKETGNYTTAYFGSIKRDSSGSRYLIEKVMMLHVICTLDMYVKG